MQEKEQNISPIKQRILSFAGTLGISKRDFYTKIGVSRGTLESKTGITEDVVTKFFATYPEVNIEWLMTGKGEMLKVSPSCKKKSQENAEKEDYNNIKVEDEVGEAIPMATRATAPGEGIPLLPIDAMAGALTDEQTVLEYECERYVVPIFKGADFLISVRGSSMYPKYSSGDIVACKRIPMTDLFFQWNKVYVLDTKQGALIKRIKPGSDKDRVLIVSDNEKYEPFELPYTALNAVAIVIGVIRLE